jgi:hypothetical protein
MTRVNLRSIALGLGVLAVAGSMAATAEAAPHGRTVSVQGAYGRGYVRSRDVSRAPGSAQVSRSFQTNSGQGVNSTRSAAWGDGAYQGGATHTFNNGSTASRSTSVQKNPDGSVSYDYSRTGVNGQTHTATGTYN